MVAKQQAHIDELVMKNRSLDQMVNKLKGELSTEKARYETSMQQLKHQSKLQQSEWKEGCDSLQSLWRIAHLKAVLELEKERTAVIKLKEDLRLERLARLQRDFRITMFQAKELELEDRLQQLTCELEGRDGEKEVDTQLAESLREQLHAAEEKLDLARQEKKQLEARLFSTSHAPIIGRLPLLFRIFYPEISCRLTFGPYQLIGLIQLQHCCSRTIESAGTRPEV